MRVDLFDFDLPDDRIALRPAHPRDAARLLVIASPPGELADRRISDICDYLKPGDVVVLNDTKVIPAQLDGRKHGPDGPGARIHLTLHDRVNADTWRVFARPARKLKRGTRVSLGGGNPACSMDEIWGTVVAKGEGGELTVCFDLAGPALDEAVKACGAMPLPPYISSKRKPDVRDITDYQTVYAQVEGAVAAPTAGLHLTVALIDKIRAIGAHVVPVTLHVGAGTFLPVKADDTKDHHMYFERGEITSNAAGAINAARAAGGRVVCVGTTTLRLLETAAGSRGEIHEYCGATDIFITPGYRFSSADILLTNFHLPRSTLFMLVSAFSGLERMKQAYVHAVAGNYRFYSYGDACLLYRAQGT